MRFQAEILQRFQSYQIPVIKLKKAVQKEAVCHVFEKVNTGGVAKVVSHGRYVTFQMAEVAVPRQMFQEILSLIAQLRPPPAPA